MMRDSLFTNASGKVEDETSSRNSVHIWGMKKNRQRLVVLFRRMDISHLSYLGIEFGQTTINFLLGKAILLNLYLLTPCLIQTCCIFLKSKSRVCIFCFHNEKIKPLFQMDIKKRKNLTPLNMYLYKMYDKCVQLNLSEIFIMESVVHSRYEI